MRYSVWDLDLTRTEKRQHDHREAERVVSSILEEENHHRGNRHS
jgi:hypothetical protein